MYRCYPCGCKELCQPEPKIVKSQAVFVDGGDVIIVVPPQIFDDGQVIKLCITKCIPQSSTGEIVYLQAGYTDANRFPIRTNSGNDVYSLQLRTRTLYPLIASSATNDFILNERYLCHTGTILTPPPTPVTPEVSPNSVNNSNVQKGGNK